MLTPAQLDAIRARVAKLLEQAPPLRLEQIAATARVIADSRRAGAQP